MGTHCGKPYGRALRRGDLVNLPVSNVACQGHTARMIALGASSDRQELAPDPCVRGLEAAERVALPGRLTRDLDAAAFAPYVEAEPP